MLMIFCNPKLMTVDVAMWVHAAFAGTSFEMQVEPETCQMTMLFIPQDDAPPQKPSLEAQYKIVVHNDWIIMFWGFTHRRFVKKYRENRFMHNHARARTNTHVCTIVRNRNARSYTSNPHVLAPIHTEAHALAYKITISICL